MGTPRPPTHLLHLMSTKVFTDDFSNHEHQADGGGHVELAPGLLLLGVTVTARTLLGMAVMVAAGDQFHSLKAEARLRERDPARPFLPQGS